MTNLHLAIRSPSGLLVDEPVEAISAEDQTGWFGILPGREDVVAVLPPGLLVYRSGDREVFVAIAGGLLDLCAGGCRVMTRDAVASENLDEVAEVVQRHVLRRRERRKEHAGIMEDLVREALRRLAARERT